MAKPPYGLHYHLPSRFESDPGRSIKSPEIAVGRSMVLARMPGPALELSDSGAHPPTVANCTKSCNCKRDQSRVQVPQASVPAGDGPQSRNACRQSAVCSGWPNAAQEPETQLTKGFAGGVWPYGPFAHVQNPEPFAYRYSGHDITHARVSRTHRHPGLLKVSGWGGLTSLDSACPYDYGWIDLLIAAFIRGCISLAKSRMAPP